MRKLALPAVAVLLIFGAEQAHAMGGGGNLSPSQSPYAIWEPQTLGAAAQTQASPPVERPAPVKRRRERQ